MKIFCPNGCDREFLVAVMTEVEWFVTPSGSYERYDGVYRMLERPTVNNKFQCVDCGTQALIAPDGTNNLLPNG